MQGNNAGADGADEIAREAAAMLRRLLEPVERGELTAGTSHAMALVRRIEGRAVALEAEGRLRNGDEPQS